jgi:hypothetical protein
MVPPPDADIGENNGLAILLDPLLAPVPTEFVALTVNV